MDALLRCVLGKPSHEGIALLHLVSLRRALAVLVLSTCVAGCEEVKEFLGFRASQTCQAMSHADALTSALDEYENSRSTAIDSVEESTDRATRALANLESTSELCEIAEAWERDWNRAEVHVQSLNARVLEVEAAAVDYLSLLDELAGSIEDDWELRAQEEIRNEHKRAEWDTAIAEARGHLTRLDQKVTEGKNILSALVSQCIRGIVDEHVASVRRMAAEAKRLLRELGELTERGRDLVSAPVSVR